MKPFSITREQHEALEVLANLLSADPTLTIGGAICRAFRDPSINGSQLGYTQDLALLGRLKLLLARTSYKPVRISFDDL